MRRSPCAPVGAGCGDQRLAGATRRVAFAARAATGSSCGASGHVSRSRRAGHLCRFVRCGSPDRGTKAGTSPLLAGASGLRTSSRQVASPTPPAPGLERARSGLGLELLGRSRLVERPGGLVAARSAGVRCQPSWILSGPCPLRCAFTPTRRSSISPTVRSWLIGSRRGRCFSMRYWLRRPSLSLTT
jgi:hypothetical protein